MTSSLIEQFGGAESCIDSAQMIEIKRSLRRFDLQLLGFGIACVPRVLGRLVLLALLTSVAPPLLASDVIYDNFGPGDSYDTKTSWSFSTRGPVIANPFTSVGNSFRLETITLPLTSSMGYPNEIDVWLMNDSGGLPDANMEAFHLSNSMPPYDGQYHPPVVVSSVLHPILEEGKQYWVAASAALYATSPGVYATWQWNVTGDTGPFAYRETGIDHWFVNPGGAARGAYRVDGVPIPEPATFTICGSAVASLFACACFWIRRRPNRFTKD